MNTYPETAARLAAIIATASAVTAIIGAVVASRSALSAMKSAYTAMMSTQTKYRGMLLPPITITATKRIDWARYFIGAIDTPFATVLTILLSIALGLSLNLLLSRSEFPRARIQAAPGSTASVSAPPPPTSTLAAPASAAPVSAPPPPTSTLAAPASAAPDHSEITGLLARGRTYLSDGDLASARVFLRRAAERNDPQAALALGGTYDPAELRRLGIPNFNAQADPAS
jgi:hypothetical protein